MTLYDSSDEAYAAYAVEHGITVQQAERRGVGVFSDPTSTCQKCHGSGTIVDGPSERYCTCGAKPKYRVVEF